MARKKQNQDPDWIQLSLFDVLPGSSDNSLDSKKPEISKTTSDQSQHRPGKQERVRIDQDDIANLETESIEIYTTNKKQIEQDLWLPETYEDIINKIGKDNARLSELILPLPKFEKEIVQVLADIGSAGYLLFLYGLSGVGKSTFISSLEWSKHIPIKQIVQIDASELTFTQQSKLNSLIKCIRNEAEKFFLENERDGDRLCIVIDYLENLDDEKENDISGFFRDLNGFLRKYGILIIWPITVKKDLEKMQKSAESFSSTMFHGRIPFVDFKGPALEEYPQIAKKTIMFFNNGKNCYEFQLTDNDLEELKKSYQSKAENKHLIRDYLKDVKRKWEERSNHISRINEKIPKPTEVWFIFCYPKAEDVVAQFARRISDTSDALSEMWNADYKALYAYISDHNQRKADWPAGRLTLALSSPMLTTKIMYLPTNALISCIAAYAEKANVPITKEEFLNSYKVKNHYCQPAAARTALSSTPLWLQLSGNKGPGGKRRSGSILAGLKNATPAFKKINEDISKKRISDQHFNRAVCLALKDLYSKQQKEMGLDFKSEAIHPNLGNIRPDILISTNEKIICLELCYSNNNTPGNIADYVLRKLNTYMKQMEENFGLSV
ncbi:hypothetical protein [Lyngbya sp. CCY1209]|uniref:hypothetical protein n=1 Tax=Lyngbya sp. CCY1209 TaxID=2886103 RepID=UPI002D20E0D1|nr:hypothetical protein [Lyngbya sp. CCY1209]MEB3883813.1 hypothetical protein [Lyngbya sp. CCY1209]